MLSVFLRVMPFATLLQAHYPLPDSSLAHLQQAASLVALPKGTRLFTDERLGEDVYFVQRGLARAYVQQEAQEVRRGGNGLVIHSGLPLAASQL